MGFTRSDVLERLRGQIESGVPIVGAGAGTGGGMVCGAGSGTWSEDEAAG